MVTMGEIGRKKEKEKEESLVGDIIIALKRIDEGFEMRHPRSNIKLISDSLLDFIPSYHYFDLLPSWLLVSLIRRLLDIHFTNKIKYLCSEELDKLDETFISGELKEMIKREFQNNLSSDYFDSDYILRFKEIKEKFSVFREGLVKEEQEEQIVAAVSKATTRILGELNAKVRDFLHGAIKVLEEKKTIKGLEEFIKEYVRNLHTEVMGWP